MFTNFGRQAQVFVGLAVLVVVLLAALPVGANRPISWIILGLAVLTLFFAQIMIDLFRGISTQAGRLWLPVLLFLTVVLWGIAQITPDLLPNLAHPAWSRVDVAGTVSADPGQGRHHLLRLLTYGMVFWVAVRLSEDREHARLAMIVAALYITGLCLFGLWAFFTGSNPILGQSANLSVVSASFPNRNNFATYAMMGLVLNLVLYLRLMERSAAESGSNKRMRDSLEAFFSGGWLYVIGLIAGLAAVALSQSRAGSAATLIALAAFVLVYNAGRKRAVGPLIVVTLVAIVGYIALTASDDLINRLMTTDNEDLRFQVYPTILQGILDRPLTGHGMGSFTDAFRPYVPLSATAGEWDLAHNSWLENAWDLGLPAAAALNLAMLLIVVRLIRGVLTRRNDRHFAAMALAICIAGAFHAALDFSFQIPAISALFAFLLGIGYAQSFRSDELVRKPRRQTD